jgi:hypothetical protein
MWSTISRREFLGTVGAAGAGLALGTQRAAAQATVLARERTHKKALIIDSHVHLKHGDATRSEWPAQVIVATMDKAGVDKSIVFAICTTTKRSLTMAEDAVTRYPDRLIAYAYALPNYERPVLEELEAALKGRLFRGIKVHAGECRLPDYIIDPVLKLAARFDVPCLIDVVGSVADAKRMAQAFPEVGLSGSDEVQQSGPGHLHDLGDRCLGHLLVQQQPDLLLAIQLGLPQRALVGSQSNCNNAATIWIVGNASVIPTATAAVAGKCIPR